MKAHVIDDPYLEFRARNQHRDPRYGVAVYGPADADSPSAPRDITVGLVGPAAAIDGMRGWLERCQTRIEAKQAKAGQENLHQPFPGFSTTATSAPSSYSTSRLSARSRTGSSARLPRPT